MVSIQRDPDIAATRDFDLIIIGGGIHGAMLSLESSLQGLSSLLLEKDDFGQHTSFNSLRIIHGGLRYLQQLDIIRFRESVSERSWFLKTFPNLVKPLPCLMPLYGDGLRRPSTFRIALFMNHALSLNRNRGISPGNLVPKGEIISPDQTKQIFNAVPTKGLMGGAVWFDAYMGQSQRVLIEILKQACQYGAIVLNYLEVQELRQSKGRVVGVEAVDRESGKKLAFNSPKVINAAGPWSRELSNKFHKDIPELFKPSLAWNILLNCKPLSEYALALRSPANNRQTYFFVPWKGKMLVGTGHAPCQNGEMDSPNVSENDLNRFLEDVNLALPGLNADRKIIEHIFSGFLPVQETGSTQLTSRGYIFNHGDLGGPEGFYSLSGIKFTTARRVAQNLLAQILNKDRYLYPEGTKLPAVNFQSKDMVVNQSLGSILDLDNSSRKQQIQIIIHDEAPVHIDDLFFRRSDLWEDAGLALEIAPWISNCFKWDENRRQKELMNLVTLFQ
jgi:glycerol-3-phosphate dehydrogenase